MQTSFRNALRVRSPLLIMVFPQQLLTHSLPCALGMAALLGPAAEKRWRQHTFGSRACHDNANLDFQNNGESVVSHVVSDVSQLKILNSISNKVPLSGNPASSHHSHSSSLPRSSQEGSGHGKLDDGISLEYSPGILKGLNEESLQMKGSISAQGARSAEGDAESQLTETGSLGSTALAFDPTKKLLATIGSPNPSNVSAKLLEEMGHRSDISSVLEEVAKQINVSGPPRRLMRKDSRKLTRVRFSRLYEFRKIDPAKKKGSGVYITLTKYVHGITFCSLP